ncbi:hypothetical protein HYN69_11690 [Gemmobacter aquarius]|uniref:Uncharacterized protein n=1 Tax=Paragemmobacter aquarius TaxID=2169400 RepID=A0A2S0UMM9_9RHOB|nr:PQQ-dependent sugar dehydrogenase [Gemmobacter aquarius]AWB49074.1 hypothetical protein HYN69_11690 [Gemmobacter aquarius]
MGSDIRPDDKLWVTERTGKRIVQIDLVTGEKTVLATIGEVEAPGGQDGLLGLALDPEMLKGTGKDYVYAAYTYTDTNRPPDETVQDMATATCKASPSAPTAHSMRPNKGRRPMTKSIS